MKRAFITTFCLLACHVAVQAQVTVISTDFGPSELGLTAPYGSWVGNITQLSPDMQVVMATANGGAKSSVFSPVNASDPTVTLVGVNAAGTSEHWRLSFYDSGGGSAFWDITPSAGGTWTTAVGNASSFTGDLDWSHVNQFEISGLGSENVFHAGFQNLDVVSALAPIPEPGVTTAISAAAMLAVGILRKLKARSS